ncbi:hypothetical protein LUZ60_009936 [Juncus effusus]|nr:hypothetical protein LUZ60_009936 [Juncus effusus]
MEASSLFTSKSFSNVPSLKPKGFLNLNKRIRQGLLSFNGVPSSSTVTHCSLGNESTSDKTDHPSTQSDWRSFRAGLVASERALNLPGFSTPLSAKSAGSKWAHPLLEPEKGCLLVATSKLDGVHIFERTVVLLLSMNPLGPMGVILNRPSLMSIKETRSISPDVADTFAGRPLFFGGPLEEGIFLVGPDGTGAGAGEAGRSGVFEEVMEGLYYGTRESVGCAAEMVKREVVGVEEFRFFEGYCGWEKEKLREEVSAGFWKVVACSASVIGPNWAGKDGLWEEILGLSEQRKVW